jgi:putative hemolysin
MLKRTISLVVIALLLVAAGLLLCRFFSGNEDTWLCEKGQWVRHGNPSSEMPVKGCGESADNAQENNVGLANPASVNCVEKGGTVDMKKDDTGGEYGMCVFPDGKQCEEWAMFRGECPVGGIAVKETSLSKPTADDSVVSPLTVEGTMPGNWYFEASAIIELYDGNNKLIAMSPVQALREWMTTSSVAFIGRLEFSAPTTPTGTLVFKNDNPSGLPENSKSESYPVFFGQTVKVFFSNSEMNPGMMDCKPVFGVDRTINKTTAVGRAALEELLKGPTEAEKSAKYFTSINSGVSINSLTIVDGIAKVDFDKQIEYQLGGSCRVSALRSQIVETLKQFPAVREVIISVDGRVDDALQP